MILRSNLVDSDPPFNWRGVNVSRLENLSDIVFGFSVTLLVVSLEVPNSFNELTSAFWQMPAFALSFYILALCWFYNYEFHRRFGLQDFRTIVLTVVQLFLVLFYVYPLKFFFSWQMELILDPSVAAARMSDKDVPTVLALYGIGWFGIFLLFSLLYRNALANAEDLRLTQREKAITRNRGTAHLCVALVGLTSVAFALIAQQLNSIWILTLSGIAYLAIGPLIWLNKRRLKATPATAPPSQFMLGDGI